MTKKAYRHSVPLSRSRKSRRNRPFPDHYNACQPPDTNDEHPVDVLIDAIPEIAALRRRLVRMSKRWQRGASDERAYIAYEDLRLKHLTLCEQAYFNAGFERGLLAGKAESREANAATRAFAHQLGLTVATSDLPQPRVAAALIEVARAVVLSLPLR